MKQVQLFNVAFSSSFCSIFFSFSSSTPVRSFRSVASECCKWPEAKIQLKKTSGEVACQIQPVVSLGARSAVVNHPLDESTHARTKSILLLLQFCGSLAAVDGSKWIFGAAPTGRGKAALQSDLYASEATSFSAKKRLVIVAVCSRSRALIRSLDIKKMSNDGDESFFFPLSKVAVPVKLCESVREGDSRDYLLLVLAFDLFGEGGVIHSRSRAVVGLPFQPSCALAQLLSRSWRTEEEVSSVLHIKASRTLSACNHGRSTVNIGRAISCTPLSCES